MAGSERSFLLLYGSQTGQAEAIAGLIQEKAVELGYSPRLYCLSQTEKEFFLERESLVVVVVSTTGEGDPPDTVSKFWRRLKKNTLPANHLQNLRYALLGLGDSNYDNFCNMAQVLNRRLQELGACAVCEPGFADDGVGLEIVVEPWMESLWLALEKVFSPGTCNCVTLATEQNSVADEEKSTQCTIEDTDLPAVENIKISRPPSLTPVVSDSNGDVTWNNTRQSFLDDSWHSMEAGDANFPLVSSFVRELRGLEDDSWQGQDVTAPNVPLSFIHVKLLGSSVDFVDFSYSDSVTAALPHSPPVTLATISGRRCLTQNASVKKTLELELCWQESPSGLKYEPGDAVCLVCPNEEQEVDYLLERLGLPSRSSELVELSVIPNNTKRNAAVPKHIPPNCTIRQLLTHCLDIRSILKKAALVALAECCSSQNERTRLRWLASRQGSLEYSKLIIEAHTDLLDVLYAFPSCHPPLAKIVELLPRLQPRYFSAASSPLVRPTTMKIAFNVVDLPRREWNGQKRMGLCTGFLDCCSLAGRSFQVPVYPRAKNPFHLPSDPLVPVIMIGPGTGVSPFVGFLQHRERLVMSGTSVGKAWLFFGCRNSKKDFLYQEELASWVSSGILTHLHVAFSQPDPDGSRRNEAAYVQDCLRKEWERVSQWVMEDGAAVYVCGDEKNMRKDIKGALHDVLDKYLKKKGLEESGETTLQLLSENGRYIVDLWT